MKRALTLLGVLSENELIHQDDVIEIIKVAFEEGQSNPRIKQLEEEIQKLKKEQAELAALPGDKQLAEALHKKLCRWNHTDGCGWFYESWEKPGYSRNEWLKKAREVLKVTDSETALKVAGIL